MPQLLKLRPEPMAGASRVKGARVIRRLADRLAADVHKNGGTVEALVTYGRRRHNIRFLHHGIYAGECTIYGPRILADHVAQRIVNLAMAPPIPIEGRKFTAQDA